MARDEVRTHYSGFIVFAVKLITVATGIAFTLMVANSLSEYAYGAWGILAAIIIPYFTLLSGIVSFWTMRFVARNKSGATKTAVVANTAAGAVVALVYLALLPIVAPSFRLGNFAGIYIIAALQVIETYVIAALEAALQARKPDFVGYGLLIGEALKVLFAYVLIIGLQQGILGAILSIVIAFAIKTAFYFRALLNELRQKIAFTYIKEWLKGSPFNLYNLAGDRIAAIIFLMLANYGGELSGGYYYASLQIANIIIYSTFIAFALQPRLLAESKIDEATASLRMVLMFAVPMTAGVIAIPSSYLLFLKEDAVYTPATPVLVILAIDSLVLTISTIFAYVLLGIERVDEKAQIPPREMMKSRLFAYFSLPYAHSAITLPLAFYTLTNFARGDPLSVAVYVTGINTAAHSAMLIVLYKVLLRGVQVGIPWKAIAKYAGASVGMALIMFSLHPARRSTTLVVTGIGAMVYFILLVTIDRETRMLVRTIWYMTRNRIRREYPT